MIRLNAEPVPSKFSSISRYMFILMVRNFATSQWIFSKGSNNERIRSAPGCIIASPSITGDPETDQDYVHYWVRDGALTVNECVYQELPSEEMLNDYIFFSRQVQQNAVDAGEPAHACFKIDGTLRKWGSQGDGPALRILSILEIWDQLSDKAQSVARTILEADQQWINKAYSYKTDNTWEEVYGYSFFARAAQRCATMRLYEVAPKLGLTPNSQAMKIAEELTSKLEDHWNEDKGYYQSILEGQTKAGPLRGDTLDSDVIFACTYANMPCFDEKMLRTVAVLRKSFETLYPINKIDAQNDMGPSIGRYPEDYYDGLDDFDNRGHPWPICTGNLARFYYQCMLELTTRPSIEVTAAMLPFFSQIGFTQTGKISKSSSQYKEILSALLMAGDKLMRAIVHHSDHLELSEQNDRDTGHCRSVRSLTWSYSSFLAASRTREKVMKSF